MHDTLQMAFKMSRQKFWITMDSSEIVQGSFYNVAVYNNQELIVLTTPVVTEQQIFHANLTDPAFNRQYVQTLSLSDSGAYRKLSFVFKSGSPYEQYEIVYDTTAYHISRIKYRVKKNEYGTTPPFNHYYVGNIYCTNYQSGTFTDSVFSTDRFFYRKEGIFNLVSPYTDYKLVNYLNQ
jgi:hypothetical protein